MALNCCWKDLGQTVRRTSWLCRLCKDILSATDSLTNVSGFVSLHTHFLLKSERGPFRKQGMCAQPGNVLSLASYPLMSIILFSFLNRGGLYHLWSIQAWWNCWSYLGPLFLAIGQEESSFQCTPEWSECVAAGVQLIAEFHEVVPGDIYMKREQNTPLSTWLWRDVEQV